MRDNVKMKEKKLDMEKQKVNQIIVDFLRVQMGLEEAIKSYYEMDC